MEQRYSLFELDFQRLEVVKLPIGFWMQEPDRSIFNSIMAMLRTYTLAFVKIIPHGTGIVEYVFHGSKTGCGNGRIIHSDTTAVPLGYMSAETFYRYLVARGWEKKQKEYEVA